MAELNSTSLLSDANIKAYYRFESGALTTDTKGLHALSTISGPDEVAGKFGGGVGLVGANSDAFSTADHADFHAGSFTVGCWYKSSATTTNPYIFHCYAILSSVVYGWQLYCGGDDKLAFQVGKGTGINFGTDYSRVTGSTDVIDGTWHLVCATSNGTTIKVWVDGEEDGTLDFGPPGYGGTQYVRIGCFNYAGSDGSFQNAEIDDAFFFTKVLTSDEMLTLYNDASPVKPFTLLGVG